MLRRTNVTLLMLTSVFSLLSAPLFNGLLPRSFSALTTSIAQAATESSLTLTPPLLDSADGRIALETLQLPAALDTAAPFTLTTSWRGDAAALVTGWEIVYQLRSADNAVAAELISERSLAATLQADEPAVAEEFWLSPELSAGTYTLSLLVRDPQGTQVTLALGLAGAQLDGSYPLGTVAVGSQTPQLVNQAAFSIYLPMTMGADGAPIDPSLGTTVGTARGYLITPQELRAIKQKADQGKAPYAANVRELLNHSSMSSTSAWVSQSSLSGSVACSDGSQKDSSGNTMAKGPIYLLEGSRLVYAKTLTANLKGATSGAGYARDARARILDLVDTTGWGGAVYDTDNQCILYLSWYISGFVMAADLLEAFPTIWTASDKRAFQGWLATQVYPKVAWASRVRTNNWGSGGSYAAAVVADYLHDSGLTLREVLPASRSLSPGTAYAEHTNEQLSRMSTAVAARDQKDSKCLPRKGIQPAGGIPDELRRASISNPTSMCSASFLPGITGSYSSPYGYQMIHLEHVLAHAELALRRGDRRLYDNIAADKSGSLLRGIKFIIANPVNAGASYDWDANRKAMLYLAYRYYRDPALNARLHKGEALRSGHTVSYGRLTHDFAAGEAIGLPPTVAPPAR